jgi:hypothetical protein
MVNAMKKSHISECETFEQMPNVARATAGDLRLMGFTRPKQLAGKDPWRRLYVKLCKKTQVRQDPCVLDVFMAVVAFADGGPPVNWWDYTPRRKELYGERLAALRIS